MDYDLTDIQFDEQGLIPAIVQDIRTGRVLTLAYMSQESLEKTLETGQTWFFSRSRQELWHKGASSGNIQIVHRIFFDCDADALIVEVEPKGPACHTGETSCFYNLLYNEGPLALLNREVIFELYDLIQDRQKNPVEGSYTNYLFESGLDKILKKIGEEATEVVIAAKNRSKDELIYELSDLIYHSLVLMVAKDVHIDELKQELVKRRPSKKKEGSV